MRIFILEDDPQRQDAFMQALMTGHQVEICATVAQAQEIYDTFEGSYDFVLLDHDLGGKQMLASEGPEPTGYTFAQWMPPRTAGHVIVHSYNPDGAEAIRQVLAQKGFSVVKQPFGPHLLQALECLPKDTHQCAK